MALTALVRAAQSGHDLTSAVRDALPAVPLPALNGLLMSLQEQGFVDLRLEYFPGGRTRQQDVYRAHVIRVHSSAAAMVRNSAPDSTMVEQRKAQRLAVLRELYTAAAGSTDEWVPRARFAGHADAATPIEVLRESGLVETRDGAIRLTASGLRDVEASYEPPPKPPPPPIHVEHHVSLSGTNVQYASPGASQTNITVIDAGAIEAMQGVVAELQRLAGVVSNAEQKRLLEANRQRLEFELATKAPNRPVVEAILTSLRTATEGMLSSAMYDGLRATLRVARRFFGA